jgi:hypothetical protein
MYKKRCSQHVELQRKEILTAVECAKDPFDSGLNGFLVGAA